VYQGSAGQGTDRDPCTIHIQQQPDAKWRSLAGCEQREQQKGEQQAENLCSLDMIAHCNSEANQNFDAQPERVSTTPRPIS